MQAAEYERIVLQEPHRILTDPAGQAKNLERRVETHGGVRIEEVRLDASDPEHEIMVLFLDLGRPDYLFGYRIEALETSDVLHARTNPYLDPASAARAWAENVWVLFEEEVFAVGCGLPNDCSPEGVTWIG